METKFIGNAREVAELLPGFDVASGWSSPEALSRFIAEGAKSGKAWHTSFKDDSTGDFYGTKTLKEALRMSQEGWKEGATKADRIRSSIAASIPRVPKAVKYGIAGSIPNVPRAIAGNLFNMKAIDLAKSRRRPVLTLVSNMAVNCGVDADSISNHASVVAALIDQIEEAGFACEVLSTATTKSGYGNSSFRVASTCLVKQSTQPVDLPRLSFALGHAAFYRRLVFGDWGLEPSSSRLGCGLGHGCDLKTKELNEKGIYVIPKSSDSLFHREEDAQTKGLNFLLAALKLQGCPAFADAKVDADGQKAYKKLTEEGSW